MWKNCPLRSVKGADTVLKGSVRVPEGFSEDKPEAAKPRGRLQNRGGAAPKVLQPSLIFTSLFRNFFEPREVKFLQN